MLSYHLRRAIPSKLYQNLTKLRFPTNNVDMRKFIVAQYCLKNGGSAIDGGAHVGYFTRTLAHLAKGTVFSFEPNPYMYKLHEKAVRGLPNVVATKAALSNESAQEVSFHVVPNSMEQDSTLEEDFVGKHQKEVRVKTMQLDELDVDELKLIKLDVEGHELSALKGGERLIRQHSPWIIFEYSNGPKRKGYEVIEYLSTLGYFCFDMETMEPLDPKAEIGLTDGLAVPQSEKDTPFIKALSFL